MTCSVEGCEGVHDARGLCNKHYQAARTRGDFEVRPTRKSVGVCIVEGCENPDRGAHGLCNMHQKRLQRHGSTDHVTRPGYPKFVRRTDEVAYCTAHLRVREERGSAATYVCVGCDAPAAEWCYRNDCPEERNEGKRRYCIHPEHYQPMCRPCHRRKDAEWRRRYGRINAAESGGAA